MIASVGPRQMPYPGLRPFEAEDAPLFFGREAQVNALLRQLEDHRFVAVVGSSGSGKSSLVSAGLLPAVGEGFLLGTTDWRVLLMRPGQSPYQGLARVLSEDTRSHGGTPVAPAGEATATPGEAKTLAALRSTDRGLLLALADTSIGPDCRVMVVVDQFEELFGFRRTAAKREEVISRDEAAGFVRLLLRSCSDPEGRVWVVLTMRSDFIGDCEAFLGLPEAVSRSQFLVPRLDRSQMEDAIARPGEVNGAAFRPFTFEEGLVNSIINDAGDRPDQLPLMQHALMRTWKLAVRRAGADGAGFQLKHEDYGLAGGIGNALSRHADQAWEEIKGDPKKARIARQLFLQLCDISPDGQITRRRPRVADVASVTGASIAEIREVVRVFQEDDRNFILPSAESLRSEDILDISHEALLRQWRLFADDWQAQERDDASELQRLAELASLHSRGKAGVLPAEDLDRIAHWQGRTSPEWAQRYVKKEIWKSVLAFIEASRGGDDASELRYLAELASLHSRGKGGLLPAEYLDRIAHWQARTSPEWAQRYINEETWEGVLAFIEESREAARREAQRRTKQLRQKRVLLITLGIVLVETTLALAVFWYRAETAKAAAQETLTNSYARTIGASDRGSISSDELTALWELAELDPASAKVRELVIDQWFMTELSVQRALNGDGRGLRSATGTNAALYAYTAYRNEELAARLVTVIENPKETDADRLSKLGKVLTALAAMMEPKEAAAVAARGAQRLAALLEDPIETDASRLFWLRQALAALAAKMESKEVASLANRLVPVIEDPKETDAERLYELGEALAALAAKMEPKVAAAVAARGAQRLAGLLEDPKETDANRLFRFGEALARLAAKMESKEAAAVAARGAQRLATLLEDPKQTAALRLSLIREAFAALLAANIESEAVAGRGARRSAGLVEDPKETDALRPSRIGHTLAALATKMESKEAASLANRLITVIEDPKETDAERLSELGEALAALAAKLESKEAASLANRLVTVIEDPKETDAERLSELGETLAALAAKLESKEAASLANRLVTVIEDPRLGEVLTALAVMMEPKEAAAVAARGAQRLVGFLEDPKETDADRLSRLGQALAALATQMEFKIAANLANRLVTAIEDPKETNTERLSELGEALAALAAKMEPKEAAAVAARGAQRLAGLIEDPKETDAAGLSGLGKALAALTARMEPEEAAAVAARSAQRLVAFLENPKETDAVRLHKLGRVLGALSLRIPMARQTQLLALSNMLVDQVPTQEAEWEESRNEREVVIGLCERLAPQDLAEVLKWPFAGGEAETIVLASLENKTGQEFGGDVWKFVEQADSLGIKDIELPAKRPRVEDALKELDELHRLVLKGAVNVLQAEFEAS